MLVTDGLVPVFPTPVAHRGHCAGKAALGRDLPDHVLAVPRPSPDMGKAEEVEGGPIRLRMACALRHLWAEIDEACLVGMEREPTSRKTLAQDRQHAFGVDDIVERYDASLANWARVLSPLRRGLSRRRAPLFRSGLPLGGDCRLCSRRLLVFRLGGPRLRLVRLL